MPTSPFLRPPRIWTPLTAVLLIIPASIVVQIVVLLFAVGYPGRPFTQEAIEKYISGPDGFLLMLLTSQFTFLLAALVPAFLSDTPWRERLGFVRARTRILFWPVLAFGSLFLIMVGGILRAALFGVEPSEHLKDFDNVFRTAPGLWGPVLALGASLLPGICEEAFFRGYVQRRLLMRWSPLLAVGFTSLVFAGVHMDPQHVVAVLPLAFWLGYVGWRTASTWPCVLCHFVVNGSSLTMAVSGVTEEGLAEPVAIVAILLVMGLSFAAFAGSIVLLEIRARE